MPEPRYTIEVHSLGWLLCAPPGRNGIPLTALSEVAKLFPNNAVMAMGIPHHYKVTGRPEVCFAVTTPGNDAKWEEEIEKRLLLQEPQPHLRWWKGPRVGLSSAAIFAVFESGHEGRSARAFANGATPRDADDLGRCLHLLKLRPDWSERLADVATAYPETAWPRIIARWSELCAAPWAQQTLILREIHAAT